MTNHFSSFEENQRPQNNTERYITFTDNEGWKEFLDLAQKINENLIDFDEHQFGGRELLDAYDECIGEYFGVGYDDQRAIVHGIADVVDLDDNVTELPRILHGEDKLIFDGVQIHPINDRWQVRLAFHPIEQDAETAPVNFYVLADSSCISELRILEKTEQEMNQGRYSDALTKFRDKATELIRTTGNDEFLELTTKEQHKALNKATMHMSAEFLPHYEATEVNVECTQFYAVPDDMLEMNLPITDFFVDQNKLNSQFDNYTPFTPKGLLINCSYLELEENNERRFNKPADFDLGFGAPCLVMYSYEDKCKYYILTQTIDDIYKSINK